MVVSLVAVAGFANFSAPTTGAPAETGVYTTSPELGADAGAVSAMAFSLAVEGDVPVQSATTPSLDTTTTSAAASSSARPGGTLERNATLTEAEVRAIVATYFAPEDVGRAVRAAWCASAFNPDALAGDGSAGLFRVPVDLWGEYSAAASVDGADILDPAANAAVAAWMVDTLGWSSLACS